MSFVSRRFVSVEKLRPLATTSGRVTIRRGLKLHGISDRRVNIARPSSKWILLVSPLASKTTTDHTVEDTSFTKTKDQRLVSAIVATGLVDHELSDWFLCSVRHGCSPVASLLQWLRNLRSIPKSSRNELDSVQFLKSSFPPERRYWLFRDLILSIEYRRPPLCKIPVLDWH